MTDQLELPTIPRRPETRPAPVRKRRRWVSWVIALLIIGLVGFAGWRLLGNRGQPAGASRAGNGPPQSVGVATVGAGNIDVILTGLGAVTPYATVTVKTQINGQLQQIAFTEGQLVHKGDFLAQIDPRPYQVALEQAQGTLARDQALLAQSKADNARYQTLSKQDSIARQQVEDQVFLIKQYEGAVITDQGAVDSAKLNLIYCHITSPVDGRIGIRLVDPGNYVQTSDTNGLFVITQLQPISVLFSLPEDDVAVISQQMSQGTLPVQAFDRANTQLIATGDLLTVDNQIDPTTGTVKLRANFSNKDNTLFPQEFVNARLLVETLKNVTTVPQAAVQTGAPGQFVYLVKPDNTVAVQVVKTGPAENGMVDITDGLKLGQQVVTDGVDRLRDGARVSIVPPPGQTAGQTPNSADPATPPRARGERRRGQPPAAATPPAAD